MTKRKEPYCACGFRGRGHVHALPENGGPYVCGKGARVVGQEIVGGCQTRFMSKRLAQVHTRHCLFGQEPTVTPLAGNALMLRLTREQADRLYCLLGTRRRDITERAEADLFRVYGALHAYFKSEK